MKNIIILMFCLTFLNCSPEVKLIPIEKITDSDKNYSIGDFKQIGFKQSHEYPVDNLPGAVSAYYGFIKNLQGNPEDYEIRFYSTHIDATQQGSEYADNITGKEGCIKKECALWTEDLKHRQHLEGGLHDTWNGTPSAKYLNYVVYGNFILMCPGYNETDALNKCTIVIEKLNPKTIE